MVIIAFTKHTSVLWPRIFCRKWRHCGPIVPMPADSAGRTWQMYTFIRTGHIEKISLRTRDMNILREHGWHFICVPNAHVPPHFEQWATQGAPGCHTCVSLSRHAIGATAPRAITPYGLMRALGRY